MVVNEQTGFRSIAVAVLCAFAVCNCLDAGRLRRSLQRWRHVRAGMVGAASFLSEHVVLVNFGVADRSRGLQTVRPLHMCVLHGTHVYVTGDQYNVH